MVAVCGARGRLLAAALAALSLVASGCGSSSSKPAQGPPASNGLALAQGSPPTEADCGFDQLGSSARSATGSEQPPAAGVYSYETRGSDSIPGTGGKPRELPGVSTQLVTPPRRKGGLTCFASEQRLSPGTRIANVYVIRGGDIYIVAIGFNTANYVQRVLPRPAILALSGTSTKYSGRFGGDTSGRYRIEIVKRGKRKVGGKSVPAVLLSVHAAFTGEIEGTQNRNTWLATDKSLLLEESGESDLRFGGDVEKLGYTVKLRSLQPGG